jgi:hypothetical protein
MPSIKIISDVAVYSSLTATNGITTPSITISESFTSPEIVAIQSASGAWESTYSNVKDTSANWNSVYTSVKDTSGNWDSVYTSVKDTSASWDTVYTSVKDTSANWDSTYTSVKDTSANWDNTYTSVKDTSANWDNTYTSVKDTSGNWQNVYTSVKDTSGNWDSVYTSVKDASGNWNETTSWVAANSSTLDVSSIDINNSHVTDPAIKLAVNGNVVIFGDLSATGSTTLVNVTANVTDSLSVVNPGFAYNALTIDQYGPLPAIHASHYGTGPLLILSGSGNVGIGTDEPNEKLTVVGRISTTPPDGYTGDISNTSDQWHSTSVALQSNSGRWDDVYSTFQTASTTFLTTETDSQTLLFDENNNYLSISNGNYVDLSVLANSQNLAFDQNTNYLSITDGNYVDLSVLVADSQTLAFDPVAKTLSITNGNAIDLSVLGVGGTQSSNWDNTYTTVNNNSANWSYQGADLKALSSNWDNTYTTVSNNSANWSYQGTDLKALSSNWQNTYTAVGTNSGNWIQTLSFNNTNKSLSISNGNSVDLSNIGGGSDVSGLSSNWQNTYTTVGTNSGTWGGNVTTGVTSGTYGSSTKVSQFTVNAYGKITSASEQTITPAGIGAALSVHTHNKSDINNFDAEVIGVVVNNSNQANKPLVLDSTAKIPTSFIPGSVDEIIESAGYPVSPGTAGKLYLDTTSNKVYRWSGTQFVEIVASPGSTDAIPEGSVNKYYTSTRVLSDAPVRSVNSKTGVITLVASDVGAAATSHTHTASNITDFNTSADARVQAAIATATPAMNGTAAVGTGTKWAKEDHVHPTDTSRAPLASPTFTGTVTIPTLAGTNATFSGGVTAVSISARSYQGLDLSSVGAAPLASPTFTGTVTVPTLSVTSTITGTGFTTSADARVQAAIATATPTMNGTAAVGTGTKWAKEDHVHPTDTSRAASVHTHTVSDITNYTASTNALIGAASATATPTMNGTAAIGTSTKWATENHVHPTDTSRAPLASPTFTGTVTVPTLNGSNGSFTGNLTINSVSATSLSATNVYSNLVAKVTTKTTSFTISGSDAGGIIRVDNSGTPCQITIPLDDGSFIIGSQIIIARLGTADVSLLAASGVTILSVENKLTLTSQRSLASLIYTASNEWLFSGDIS